MARTARRYEGESDLPLIDSLIRDVPLEGRHLVDYPWRLSSPAAESGHDVRLWVAADGTLAALAAWQQRTCIGAPLPAPP